MSFSRGPNIVTDGLVLALDAGSTRSYTSGSSVWNDLSSTREIGTISEAISDNGSLLFDGINDEVTFSSSSIFNLNEFSLEIFFKGVPTQLDTYVGLITKDNPSFGSFTMAGELGSSYVRFGFYGGGSNREIDASAYPDLETEEWVHYLGTFDGTTLELYRNGISVDSNVPGFTPAFNTNPVKIGGRSAGIYHFKGNIAIVRIYNRGLTTKEALQNYNAQKNRFI